MSKSNINNQTTKDEILALSIFTAEEINKDIKTIKSLIAYTKVPVVDASPYSHRKLDTEVLAICTKINDYLPKLQHNYLNQSVTPLKELFLQMCAFINMNSNRNNFDDIFVKTIKTINDFFTHFQIPEGLSLTPSPTIPSDGIDDRPLHERILQASELTNSEAYRNMISDMAQSTKQRNLTNDNFKVLSDGILANYNGKSDINPTRDAITDLLIASVARLHQRQAELRKSKQIIIGLSDDIEELSLKEQHKRRMNNLAREASSAIITS